MEAMPNGRFVRLLDCALVEGLLLEMLFLLLSECVDERRRLQRILLNLLIFTRKQQRRREIRGVSTLIRDGLLPRFVHYVRPELISHFI